MEWNLDTNKLTDNQNLVFASLASFQEHFNSLTASHFVENGIASDSELQRFYKEIKTELDYLLSKEELSNVLLSLYNFILIATYTLNIFHVKLKDRLVEDSMRLQKALKKQKAAEKQQVTQKEPYPKKKREPKKGQYYEELEDICILALATVDNFDYNIKTISNDLLFSLGYAIAFEEGRKIKQCPSYIPVYKSLEALKSVELILEHRHKSNDAVEKLLEHRHKIINMREDTY